MGHFRKLLCEEMIFPLHNALEWKYWNYWKYKQDFIQLQNHNIDNNKIEYCLLKISTKPMLS